MMLILPAFEYFQNLPGRVWKYYLAFKPQSDNETAKVASVLTGLGLGVF